MATAPPPAPRGPGALPAGAPTEIWLKDLGYRFRAVNAGLVQSCGVPAEELVGRVEAHFFPRRYVARFRASDGEVCEAQRARYFAEESTVGRYVTLKVPLLDGAGTLLGTLGMAWKLDHPGGEAAWLGQVQEALHAGFRRAWSVGRLARAAGRHPDHLSRAFRQAYGLTVSAYVQELRVRWAACRVLGSEAPLSAIAREAGFSDQSHFTRQFRRAYGVTPRVYRLRHRVLGLAAGPDSFQPGP